MQTEMRVTGLTIDPRTDTPVVMLTDSEARLSLPIWIGLPEASAIATELERLKLSGPMTHDLLCSLIATLGATLEAIEVFMRADESFFARLMLQKDGQTQVLEARPSDAIAVALRLKCPIFVTDEVLKRGGGSRPGRPLSREELELSQWAEFLEQLPSEGFGRYKM